MTGVVTPYSLMFAGVAAAVLPLAPFPAALYLRDWLRRRPVAALCWYALAALGLAWAAVAFVSRQPQLQWAIGLGLALSWWFVATATATDQPADPPAEPAKSKPEGGVDAQSEPEGGADA